MAGVVLITRTPPAGPRRLAQGENEAESPPPDNQKRRGESPACNQSRGRKRFATACATSCACALATTTPRTHRAASTNKCLAKSNKSGAGGKATNGHLEKLLSPPIADSPRVNVHESEREQSGISRRQFCGVRRLAAIFRGALTKQTRSERLWR